MLWIYLGWIAILLGASLASSLAAFRYQPVAMRLPAGYEIYALLRLVGRFRDARREGRGLHTAEMLELEPMLTDSLLQEFLAQDRKSTRLNSSHVKISYAVFCLKKKNRA